MRNEKQAIRKDLNDNDNDNGNDQFIKTAGEQIQQSRQAKLDRARRNGMQIHLHS